MIFILITFFTAFLIEGLGTVISVYGLSHLFGANKIIIALAIALDLGKLVVVSLTYSHWKKLNFVMRSYAIIATIVTMTITSAGAAGYLAGQFQTAILATQEGGIRVDMLKKEQAKLEERKRQIDDQLASVPEKYSAQQRIKLINQFKEEQQQVTARLSKIDKELPELQITQIGTEAKAGPILFISKAFDVPVETAVKWIILSIIFVFDPLAVFLIIAGNFLLDQRRNQKQQLPAESTTKTVKQLIVDKLTSKVDDVKKESVDDTVQQTVQPQNINQPVDNIVETLQPTTAEKDEVILSITQELVEPIVDNVIIQHNVDTDEPLHFVKKLKEESPQLDALKFREPDSVHESELIPLISAREQITKETLGIDSSLKGPEVGIGTGAFKT